MNVRRALMIGALISFLGAAFVAGRWTSGDRAPTTGRAAEATKAPPPDRPMSANPMYCLDAFPGLKLGMHDCWGASTTGYDHLRFGSGATDDGRPGILLSTILGTAGFELTAPPEDYGEVRIYYVDLKTRRLCFVNAQGRVGQVDFNGTFAIISPEAGCPPV